MGRVAKIARRTFLGLGVAAAGGLAVGYYMYKRPYSNPLEEDLPAEEAAFTPYIRIGKESGITIIAPRAEMGQGIHTTLAALVAEELDVGMDQIKVEHGLPGKAYYNQAMFNQVAAFPWFDDGLKATATREMMRVMSKFIAMQATGGSSSTIDGYEKMRRAGAAAREVLKAAAAKRWNVDVSKLETEAGKVIHPDGRTLEYTELATDAAKLEIPSSVELRSSLDWKILGKPQRRVDIRKMVTGAPIFGIDVQLPDMIYGTVRMSPRMGAKAVKFDDAPALAIKGVRKVVQIDTAVGSGFGIIADNTWAAFQGAKALEVEWGEAPYPADDAGIETLYRDALARAPDWIRDEAGDVDKAFADAEPATVVEAEYEVPFLAHATMEPMSATAQFRDGKLTIWTGTQMPGVDAQVAAKFLGIETEDVTVHVTRLGGSFGRRAGDPALYAAALAPAAEGRPVKVTWSREEDMQHGFYRPRALAKLRAIVQPGKSPETIDVSIAAPSVMAGLFGRFAPETPLPAEDEQTLEGMAGQPNVWANSRFAAHNMKTAIQVGLLRSVGGSYNGFFHEGFMDELAEKAGLDPIDMRISMMSAAEHRPARLVMEKLRDVSNWGRALPPGHGKGVGFTLSYGSWVGEVVEVAVTDGDIRIVKVWCVADPGHVLDPAIYSDQMMSGIIFGLSTAMGQAITFEDGRVQQENFYDFDAIRMAQCPEIEVHLLENSPRIGGAGECGVPPSIPALANAIHAVTGKRLRKTPFNLAVSFA
ncbi:xanthine dehydrogenase family protein molybdopterin-binding subunit [Rhizobium sullae]|uniref:Isoquinoline 1-oxidoreductase beta subunit n=1 Tax=Rhizobium sullae TaxID=50338 RepID=A0A4R3PRA2_RHISU|nr:molybdopterin cofactor-binding domain-containing protein [Rhizobium sullae]TCU06084.1 isoquinoline 1-oxidoreductase beta subunit [Rhizobium sullae]UWU19190.1 molybdopterin-dependent oxidoreductase [Rhizobium sullae]